MTSSPVVRHGSGARIHAWVVPRSSRSSLEGAHGGRLKLKVTAPPEGGKANRESARLLEEALGVSVTLIQGMRGRHKVFEVAEGDVASLRRRLGLGDAPC